MSPGVPWRCIRPIAPPRYSAPDTSGLTARSAIELNACVAAALPVARLARRLRDDFELDRAGLALALRLMQRIDTLEQEVERLRARLPVRHNPS